VQVGIGLPTTTADTGGALIAEWARRAEAGPFSSVAVLDRLAYAGVEPFTALAAAAAVTTRIRLATMIAIGPLRGTAMLAKLAGSVNLLGGGLLTLGLGIGARDDDYGIAGIPRHTRGRMLSEQPAALRTLDEPLELLVGGSSGAALARMARYADGYAHGGGPPRAFAAAADRALAAWSDLGRPGRPRLWGQGYFGFGRPDEGRAYLLDYYAFTGPFAERIARGNLTSPREVKDFVRGYAAAGCDELILLPTVSDPADLDRLAEVLA
jgi:alkanesulfonate monooxygenase SsuD/methylene tetrahydromethanopterin reductase-like flavin-dependent oxidoreductase (luciferase family)